MDKVRVGTSGYSYFWKKESQFGKDNSLENWASSM